MKFHEIRDFPSVQFSCICDGCRTSMHGKVKLVIDKYYLLPVVTQQIG